MSQHHSITTFKLDLGLDQFANELDTRSKGEQMMIKDPIRKKWMVLTPEEMVRQLLILYLIKSSESLKRLISVEKQIVVNGLKKRFDLLIYNNQAEPLLLIECKAPGIPLNDKVLQQISIYNVELKVPYLLITNGRDTYFCEIDFDLGEYRFLTSFDIEKIYSR